MAGKSTSIPEQAILYYVKKIYPDAAGRRKIVAKNRKKYEADIFIPSINVAIEYNGEHWHSGRESRDLEKNYAFSEIGIFLVVILEGGLKDREIRYGVSLRHSTDSSPGLHMNEIIENTLHVLAEHTDNPVQKQLASAFSLSYEQYCQDYSDIVKPIFSTYCEDNITHYCIFNYWDEGKNKGIDPSMIPVKTSAKFWYRCPSGYSFRIAPRDYQISAEKCDKKCEVCAYNLCPFISICPVYTKWEKGHIPITSGVCQYIQEYIWSYVLNDGNWPKKYCSQLQFKVLDADFGLELELLRRYYKPETSPAEKKRIINVLYTRDDLSAGNGYAQSSVISKDYVFRSLNACSAEDISLCKRLVEEFDWNVIIRFANFQNSVQMQNVACDYLDWILKRWKYNSFRLTRYLQLIRLPYCSGGLEREFEEKLRKVLIKNKITFDLPIFGAASIKEQSFFGSINNAFQKKGINLQERKERAELISNWKGRKQKQEEASARLYSALGTIASGKALSPIKAKKTTPVNSSIKPVVSQSLPKNSPVLKKAIEYVKDYEFSARDLVKQLEHEGFSHSQSEAAVAMCGADWSHQAYRAAKMHFETEAFSKKGIIRQLEYDGFTHEEACAGVEKCNVNWKKNALRNAESYLEDGYPKKHLAEQLQHQGFEDSEIEYVLSRI